MVDKAGQLWLRSPPTSLRDRVMGSHTERYVVMLDWSITGYNCGWSSSEAGIDW